MSDPSVTFNAGNNAGARWGKWFVGALGLALVVGAGAYGLNFVRRAMLLERLNLASQRITSLADALTAYRTYEYGFIPFRPGDLGPEMDIETVLASGSAATANPEAFTGNLEDPFSPVPGGRIRYWSDADNWKLWSAGPDSDYDMTDSAAYLRLGDDLPQLMAPYQYDPTNGILSSGDVIYIHRWTPPQNEFGF